MACPLCPLGELLLFPFFAQLFIRLYLNRIIHQCQVAFASFFCAQMFSPSPSVSTNSAALFGYTGPIRFHRKREIDMRYFKRGLCLAVSFILLIFFLQSCWSHRGNAVPQEADCRSLLPLSITCEERIGAADQQLSDLQPGDLLVTFSTHTLGWRHGHAALVIDSSTVLEAAMPGTLSGFSPADSWTAYASLLHLRVRDVTPQQQAAVVDFAKSHLIGLPYGFFCGLGQNKAPTTPHSLQCAYLPWYAWQAQDIDLDSDGGKLVTVLDLAQSPQLNAIQSWGLPLPNKK